MPRTVFCADARVWLAENPPPENAAVITSLPDVSEIGRPFDHWREWFMAAARQIFEWMPRDGNAVFFQSDIRHRGAWVDKGYLVQRAAEDVGVPLAWHKIVCRHPAGTVAHGRASYSHMLCFSRLPTAKAPGPDVIDNGEMTWTRAMGLGACRVAVRYLVQNTSTRVVVDPYCGRGTVLAVAEGMGLETIGVELNAKRAGQARTLDLSSLRPSSSPSTAPPSDAPDPE